jgi:transposase
MYSASVRKIACHVYSLLHSLRKTEALVLVSKSTIARWLHKQDRAPYPKRSTPSKAQLVAEVVRSAVQCNPLSPVTRLQSIIRESLSLTVSHQLIRAVLRSLGYTWKKARFCGRPANQDAQVAEFIQQRDRALSQGQLVVSVDETAFGRHSAQHVRGYAPRGQPLYVSKKRPHVKTTSVVACVSASGIVGMSQATNKAFNTESFLGFLKALELPARTVVLLDNVRFHHSRVVKDFAREAALQLLYVPPYSPWFNPIEYCFSIVKRAYVRCEDVGDAFKALRRDHCEAFFRKSLSASQAPVMASIPG